MSHKFWAEIKSVPEFQTSTEPRDPFPTDIYYAGNMIREHFLDVCIFNREIGFVLTFILTGPPCSPRHSRTKGLRVYEVTHRRHGSGWSIQAPKHRGSRQTIRGECEKTEGSKAAFTCCLKDGLIFWRVGVEHSPLDEENFIYSKERGRHSEIIADHSPL